MTKLIAALIIVAVLYGGWDLFMYWEKVRDEEEAKQKQDAAAMVTGDQLPGLPYQLKQSWRSRRSTALPACENWLKTHGQAVRTRARPGSSWITASPSPGRPAGSPARLRRREGTHSAPPQSGRGLSSSKKLTSRSVTG